MVIFFYLFASLVLISALGVITSKNPVHSVLWLIFAFCNSAGLMVLIGAEFLAMMLIVIYVGAVAVLFLFIVMMLDTNKANKIITSFSTKGVVVLASFLLADLLLVIFLDVNVSTSCIKEGLLINKSLSNIVGIGSILYTNFILPFQIAGIILFVAIIASISLTIKTKNPFAKLQDPSKQLARNKASGIEITKPELNKGISEINY